MKSHLKNIVNPNLNEQDIDPILNAHIGHKFDTELKEELTQLLPKGVLFSEEKTIQKDFYTKNRVKQMYASMAIAASLALLVIAYNFFQNSTSQSLAAGDPPPWQAQKSSQQLALAYMAESEIYHTGALKGHSNGAEIRKQAIQAFNSKKYAEAQQYFEQIKEKTDEDLFYNGIAALYTQAFEAAIADLKVVSQSKTRFQEEASWYLALAYISKGDQAAAKNILSAMQASSWNYDKSRELLKVLE